MSAKIYTRPGPDGSVNVFYSDLKFDPISRKMHELGINFALTEEFINEIGRDNLLKFAEAQLEIAYQDMIK